MADQSIYQGSFKDDEYNGIGTLKTFYYIYKGEFIKGKKNGKGVYEDLLINSLYEGEFKNDFKDGHGVEQYSDGSKYEGDFKGGSKDGNGVLILKGENNMNSVYKGQFKKDKIWGKGIYKWSNKKFYCGEWENNEISGFGALIDEKVKHIGFFSHDKKEGYGASFYIEQSHVLLSRWKNDLIEGFCVIYPLNKNDQKKEVIVYADQGNIINEELNENDILKIKSSNEYKILFKLFQMKFMPEYFKFVNKNIDDIKI